LPELSFNEPLLLNTEHTCPSLTEPLNR